MKLFKSSLILIITTVFTLSGQILEVNHFNELEAYLSQDTLLILDIDDTLLLPVQMLGCDEWFKNRLSEHQSNGEKPGKALDKALAEWEAIRHLTKMRLVQEGSDEIVRQLQTKGHMIMGLTNQGLALATRTVNQLKEHGIDLSVTAPSQEEYYTELGHHGILFRKGVLFTSGTHKGKALFSLLKKIGFFPKRIVFLNDKETHLRDIEESCLELGVEYFGLRFAFADLHKAQYIQEVADYQFTHSTLQKLISDEEAQEKLTDSLIY